jgi:replicative DNA helicase
MKYPSDIEAEYSLIGCILCKPEIVSGIGFLQAEHFHSMEYSDVYSAISTLHAEGNPITAFSIKPFLTEATAAHFGNVAKHLADSISASMAVQDPVAVAKRLVDLARKRELAQACEGMANLICASDKPLSEFAGDMMVEIERINGENPVDEFQDDSQVIAEILDDLKDERRPSSTGINSLDEAMGGGLYPGKSYGFAAKKKIGKTILAGTISLNLSNAKVKHLFICGEMSPKEIHQRSLARITESYSSVFRDSYGRNNQFQEKLARIALNSGKHILYKNAPGLTFDEFKRSCRNAVERHKVKGIILDYWQLVGGKGKNQSTSEHLDAVAQWIADFGRKMGVWFIVMAQINQEGNTRGGEGIRLAFDQVYQIKPQGDDPSMSGRWLEMMDSRYTKWMNLGTESEPRLLINEKGPFFEEVPCRKSHAA